MSEKHTGKFVLKYGKLVGVFLVGIFLTFRRCL